MIHDLVVDEAGIHREGSAGSAAAKHILQENTAHSCVWS